MLKGALNRAYTFCSKKDLLEHELNYLKMNFQDNGYNKHKIDTIIKNYKPKTRQEKYTGRLRTRNKTKEYKINKNITHVSISYIKHLNNALKKAFYRNNVSYYTHAGPKLGSILCNNNKTDRMQKKVYTKCIVFVTQIRLVLDRQGWILPPGCSNIKKMWNPPNKMKI